MKRPTIALWSTNLHRPFNGLDGWIADVAAKLDQARIDGADFLVAPEYWSEQWLAFKPDGLTTDQEMAWMADQAPAAIDALAAHVKRTGVALIAGSIPWHDGKDGQFNRAYMLLPDGRRIHHDKIVMTPAEKDPANWCLTPGNAINLIEWQGWRLTMLICLDIEIPALSVALAPHQPDIVFVPSMTSMLSGYSRVYSCAKARAVEMMTCVAVCGCVGAAIGTTYNDTNVSGAALYVPCEKELGFTGIFAEHPPVGEDDGDGPYVIARDIPIDLIRAKRQGGAEVWPGTESVGTVTVKPA